MERDDEPASRVTVRIQRLVDLRAKHRMLHYLNNLTVQSHRSLKQHCCPMLGFGNLKSASRFCSEFDDELWDYFRVKRRGSRMSRLPASDRSSSTDGDLSLAAKVLQCRGRLRW